MAARHKARLVGALLGAIVAACAAQPRPSIDGHAVSARDSVPVEIERYPRAQWHGRWAYLVKGEWWYPTDAGWVVFDEVPPELQSDRPWVMSAPPGTATAMQGPYGGGPPPIMGPPSTPADGPQRPGEGYPH